MSDHLIAALGLFVALAALVIAIYSWTTTSRAARNDVLAQVRDWGAEVVDLFAEARGLCEMTDGRDSDEVVRRASELRTRASALADRGRFFFPNSKGLRPPILDLVMIAYELLPGIADKSGNNVRRGKAFHFLQAAFVITVRKAVNFSRAPGTVKRYEERLTSIPAPLLPREIVGLMAQRHKFEVMFDDRPLDQIPPRDT